MHAAPSSTLDQYRPAPRPEDGFASSGAEVGPHLGYSAELQLDYASDPLVFENVAGRSSSQSVELVSDQLTAHALVSLGLYEIALLYAGLPVNLVMSGQTLGTQPTATGFGAGDLQLGGRLRFYRGKQAQVAFQLTLTAPTAERGSHGRPGVAGDNGVTAQPEVTSEIEAGPLSLLFDVGARWRKDARFAGTRFTDVLTFGAGVCWPFVPDLLRAIGELHGGSPLDDVGNRQSSPLEALLGLKLGPLSGFTVGLGAGLGILRGYGSPQARVVAMVGYASRGPSGAPEQAEPQARPEPEAQPVEPQPPEAAAPHAAASPAAPPQSVPTLVLQDRDHDGTLDAEDRCPRLPGPPDRSGCPRFLDYDEHSGEIALQRLPRFTGSADKPVLGDDEVLGELLAALRANPELHVRVEAHMARGADARKTMAVSVARAAALRAWLLARGVDSARVEAVGCGSNRPLVPERSSQHQRNERIELYVVSPLPAAGLRSSLGCNPVESPPPAAATRAPAALSQPLPGPAAPKPTAAPAPAPAPALAASATTAQVAALLASQPQADADGDGSANAKDACPLAPGRAADKGCPESHRVDLAGGRIELLKPIRFEEGSDEVSEHSRSYVVELAATLRANPTMKVALEDHVAGGDDAKASLALSARRAAALRKQLATAGVAPERIKAYGCGQSRPIAPDNVPWGRRKNDRVELHLLDPAPSAGVHSEEGCSASE